MNNLAALAVFSGISLNLLIQMGIGIRDFNREPYRPFRFILFQWFSLVVSTIVLWCFFTLLPVDFLEYFLLFPLIAALGKLWGFISCRLFPQENYKDDHRKRVFSMTSVHNGQVMAVLLVTERLAGSFYEVLALIAGFSLGFLAAVYILRAIHGRFFDETARPLLRGTPLFLITTGLLALIFSSLSVIFLRLLKYY
jgi:Na+-transporting NADH:ubiquinone oxidoreductase subunit NqrE